MTTNEQIAGETAATWRPSAPQAEKDALADHILKSIERATADLAQELKLTTTQLATERHEAAQPQPSKARKEQAPRDQGSPASGERSERELKLYGHSMNCKKVKPDGHGDCYLGNEACTCAASKPRGQQQEWTVEWLDEMLDLKFERGPVSISLPDYMQRLGVIADAHNAELAAEREEVRIMTNQCVQLRQALAADRQRREFLEQEREAIRTGLKREFPEEGQDLDDIVEALGTFIDHHKEREQQLLSALEAIDQMSSFCPDAVINMARRATNDLSLLREHDKELLLSYQAAIDRHNKSEWPGCAGTKIDVDLSALHEHDAKVREPLVDALEQIQSKAKSRITCSRPDICADCTHFEQIRSIASEVLVKKQ